MEVYLNLLALIVYTLTNEGQCAFLTALSTCVPLGRIHVFVHYGPSDKVLE